MFVNIGLDNVLQFMIDSPDFELTYRLFKNNHTVTKNSVLADFTESDFEGYAPKAAVEEPDATVNVDDEAQSLGDEVMWEADDDTDPPQQAFGVYVTFTGADAASKLLMAFNFDDPQTVAFLGDKVKVKVDWYTKNFVP